jgi:acyl-CoA synthetase (AMP-forming)/AMP-acid ligase II
LRWVEIEKAPVPVVASRIVDADQLALLQYTSGSTGRPKGVMLTHANLMTNIHAIGQLFEPSRDDRAVFWLPPYHDMGLIGAVMSSLVHGVHTTLMSPGSFVRRPRRWLETISRTSATISGAPNFAYALCASRLGAQDIGQLDLRSWRVAFCGAEPIQADVMRHFCERFSVCGFSERALYPCYGLAEATLMVTGGKRGSGLKTRRVDPRKLESEGRATEPDSSHRGRELVGCGEACANHRVRIVDPNTCQPLPERCVGEIWFAGASVAAGYWDKPAETHQTFRARLHNDADRTDYLRTGDLGFQDEGDLFVTGRLKDVIIVAGRNLYPEDLEVVAGRSHDLLAARRGAAFSVDDGIVLLHEIDHKSSEHDVADVRRAVAAALLEEHGITLHRLLLVRPNSLPLTTSGKVRRAECRLRFLHGGLADAVQQAN